MQRFPTYLSGKLYNLQKDGPNYLSNDESRDRIREDPRSHDAYLGKQGLLCRGAECWGFFRQRLAGPGYPLSALPVSSAASSCALDLLADPKMSLNRARQALRERRPRDGADT